MSEDADEPLPGDALLLAEGGAYVGEQQEGVWDAALAELAGVDHPAGGRAGECVLFPARDLDDGFCDTCGVGGAAGFGDVGGERFEV